MAKSLRCPKCGRQTFKKSGLVRECTDKTCMALGWLGGGPFDPGERGRVCKSCDSGTMKTIATLDDGTTVNHCYTCSATYVL